MISGHIFACIISLTFFSHEKLNETWNYFVRDSCGLSFTSHSILRMRDEFCTFTFSSAFLYLQLNGYFILISTFLFNKYIDKLLGYCRITFDNHLFLGVLEFQFVLRVFQVAFVWFGICLLFDILYLLWFVIWRIFYVAFVCQLRFISIAVSLSTVVAFKSKHERNSTKASYIETVHLLAL